MVHLATFVSNLTIHFYKTTPDLTDMYSDRTVCFVLWLNLKSTNNERYNSVTLPMEGLQNGCAKHVTKLYKRKKKKKKLGTNEECLFIVLFHIV